METIKTSWNRLLTASQVGAQYLREHPEKTKLEYTIQRTLPRIAKKNDELQELLDGIGADHAVTGNVGGVEGVILRTAQGGYQFTPAMQKKCSEARRKLLDNPEGVQVEVHFATELPRDTQGKLLLEMSYLDAFDGIIIRSEDVARAYNELEGGLETAASDSTEQVLQ